MENKFKKTISVATLSLTFFAIGFHPDDEEPHIHPENFPPLIYSQNNDSTATSATTYVTTSPTSGITILRK